MCAREWTKMNRNSDVEMDTKKRALRGKINSSIGLVLWPGSNLEAIIPVNILCLTHFFKDSPIGCNGWYNEMIQNEKEHNIRFFNNSKIETTSSSFSIQHRWYIKIPFHSRTSTPLSPWPPWDGALRERNEMKPASRKWLFNPTDIPGPRLSWWEGPVLIDYGQIDYS